jgi:hypothetical protein
MGIGCAECEQLKKEQLDAIHEFDAAERARALLSEPLNEADVTKHENVKDRLREAEARQQEVQARIWKHKATHL